MPKFHVVLHDDAFHALAQVRQLLPRVVPDKSQQEAEYVVATTHKQGRCVVRTCHLELAELYQQGLQSFMLTATIRPA